MKVAFVRSGLHEEPVGSPHTGERKPEVDLPWGMRVIAVPMLMPDSHIVGQVNSKGRLLLIDDPASLDGRSDNLFDEPLVDVQQFGKVWRIVVGLVKPGALIVLEVDEMRFARSFHQLVQSREVVRVEDLVQGGKEVVTLGIEVKKFFLF